MERASARTPRARSYLILNNVQKLKNLKNMLLSARAFGVSEVFLVGQRRFDVTTHEAFLARLGLPLTREVSLAACRARCVAHGIRIVGVEILAEARSLLDSPFDGDTAFILGNEGAGMNAAQIAICDAFVYIPQYGGGTASLNVTVAASIVLQNFALWARLPMVAAPPRLAVEAAGNGAMESETETAAGAKADAKAEAETALR